MLDQHQDNFRRDRFRGNLCNSFELEEPSRQSLHEIDFNQLVNLPSMPSQQLRKTTLLHPGLSQLLPPKPDQYACELQEMRT